MQRPSPKTYNLVIRSIPVLCIVGFLSAILGAIADKHWVIRLGTCLFYDRRHREHRDP